MKTCPQIAACHCDFVRPRSSASTAELRNFRAAFDDRDQDDDADDDTEFWWNPSNWSDDEDNFDLDSDSDDDFDFDEDETEESEEFWNAADGE